MTTYRLIQVTPDQAKSRYDLHTAMSRHAIWRERMLEMFGDVLVDKPVDRAGLSADALDAWVYCDPRLTARDGSSQHYKRDLLARDYRGVYVGYCDNHGVTMYTALNYGNDMPQDGLRVAYLTSSERLAVVQQLTYRSHIVSIPIATQPGDAMPLFFVHVPVNMLHCAFNAPKIPHLPAPTKYLKDQTVRAIRNAIGQFWIRVWLSSDCPDDVVVVKDVGGGSIQTRVIPIPGTSYGIERDKAESLADWANVNTIYNAPGVVSIDKTRKAAKTLMDYTS